MRFKTESGAEYVYEDDYLTRKGSFSPGIDYELSPDEAPQRATPAFPVQVGRSAVFILEDIEGRVRITTPVTEIEGDR